MLPARSLTSCSSWRQPDEPVSRSLSTDFCKRGVKPYSALGLYLAAYIALGAPGGPTVRGIPLRIADLYRCGSVICSDM